MKRFILFSVMLTFLTNSMSQNTPSESIYDIQINKLSGETLDLSTYKDKYLLFVNLASECGFTGQYEGLQKLYDQYNDKLMVIGVPCNQFGSQEPGTADEIKSFCQSNYGVTFIMTEKVEVKGEKDASEEEDGIQNEQ